MSDAPTFVEGPTAADRSRASNGLNAAHLSERRAALCANRDAPVLPQ
jgi:hypothetical protein